MASTTSNISPHINFIADLPKYKVEKPFTSHQSLTANPDLKEQKATDNVKLLSQSVNVSGMRGNENITLDRSGFCYIEHKSKYLPSSVISLDSTSLYRKETEELLASYFNAELTFCYDVKLRKNSPGDYETYDPGHPLFVEQAAAFAHDVSPDTAPGELKRLMNEDQLKTYSQPGYRFRLINTWKCLLPKCEDRPMAFCDYGSVNMHDLLAADRVRSATRRKEIFCPHTSVDNPSAPTDAPSRESVETRTLVITKM
ncbi:hypothetical protein N7478_007686 [Penicillium angulare]|uniref:uncharacterized protein n=1 Tax=Penicillium angulare TaxID=116970 RepID=UPI00253F8E6A|nr:uncharacterized protein N7478_007686 [Penicillium angulare]KAJ5272561.1 hypothetical protein N7478_007686 [Penicillium angulare]